MSHMFFGDQNANEMYLPSANNNSAKLFVCIDEIMVTVFLNWGSWRDFLTSSENNMFLSSETCMYFLIFCSYAGGGAGRREISWERDSPAGAELCLCLRNSGQEMVSDASEISPAVAFCLLSHRKRITALTHTS